MAAEAGAENPVNPSGIREESAEIGGRIGARAPTLQVEARSAMAATRLLPREETCGGARAWGGADR